MRIVFTVPWARRSGGAEQMLQALVARPAQAYEPEVVFLESGPWADELRATGVRVEVLEAGRLRRADLWARTVLRLARIIRARRPDLIVNWSAKTQLYGAPAAIAAGMGRRVVWWQHSIPAHHWMDRAATLLPARAIGCTSEAAAQAQQRLRPRRPTFVVHAGTPEPTPLPGPESAPATGAAAPSLEIRGDLPVLGIVARLQPWKGQDRLLRALALLRDRGHPAQLLLVGGDSFELGSEYARSLPQLVRELGLEDLVTLTGEVADAGPYIELMDVLVSASEAEPFGIGLLEAMSRGVAVLAVDRGGPREIIRDRETGVLAASGEPASLADAIEWLLERPEERRAIAAAGRERFRSEFTEEALRDRFAELARELAREAT